MTYVTKLKIHDGTVTKIKIRDGTVTMLKIRNGTVKKHEIRDGTVTLITVRPINVSYSLPALAQYKTGLVINALRSGIGLTLTYLSVSLQKFN